MALPYNHQSLSLSFSCRSTDKYVGACWGRDETADTNPFKSWRHRWKPNRVSARDQTSECYRTTSFFHSSPYLHVNSATLPRSVYVIDPFTFLATDRTQLESGHSMGQPNLVFMVKSLSSPPMRPASRGAPAVSAARPWPCLRRIMIWIFGLGKILSATVPPSPQPLSNGQSLVQDRDHETGSFRLLFWMYM